MAPLSAAVLSIALGAAGLVSAQIFPDIVNVTMCNWNHFRVGVIRDTVYLDGGILWWAPGREDGGYGALERDKNVDGDVFTLSLSTPFDTTRTNLTSLFGRLKPFPGAGSSLARNYMDGAMFASENEFILYGYVCIEIIIGATSDCPSGLVSRTNPNPLPYSDQILSYERYFWGPEGVTTWSQGFVDSRTNNDVTRYITHGASVSVPSENRGYYFSGLRGEDWGEISIPSPKPDRAANTLISVDMTEWRGEQWTNNTKFNVTPRGKAELSWIPVSDAGVLIAVGGVPYPETSLRTPVPTQDQQRSNKVMGESFMKTVPVYDIDSGNWYTQNTTGEHPPARSDFCSVVASAKDGSSHNIYIYGGYGGSHRNETSSDDVYILSVPSFEWIKAPQGRSQHGRRGHQCVKPYPDKMLVIGGIFKDSSTCLDGGLIQVLNLNSVEFQNVYDPEEWEEYKVPEIVTSIIGGNADGDATMTEPRLGWEDEELGTVFRKKYPKPIKTYYPYRATGSPTETPGAAPSGGGGLPKWVGPVLGVVLGLILITGLVVAWLLWRRRKDRRYASSVGATSDNRKRIMRWIYGTGAPPGKNIDATTTTATDPGLPPEKHLSAQYSEAGNESVLTPHSRSAIVYSDLNEAASSPVHELQDNSNPALGATVIAPLELPTEYNESPISSRPRFPSDAESFLSPVSPEPGPVSPPVSPPPESTPRQPTHNRHNSSLSSTGFQATLNNTMTSDNNNHARAINEEEDMRRGHFVSGITEDFSSDSESRHEGEPEFKTW
ncbi:hypothetical protein CIHG_00007 [Coccidioides immitis H538.4]|uniref:Kelch repeat protein n=2 Tax=Coccidioides immitis TaxID=5501 RepID=A0A0J8RCI4_COCIT|nr:hypothetical protein CIRG_06827 [Coccidioides immitis RMSCC 2394]KMU82221.1 hypothetical protein CIHG_00007 [Coccidioides immitis H538.4]TPX19159.1 hypothetical protein DIZ76_016945 [Coccidioides immitis]